MKLRVVALLFACAFVVGCSRAPQASSDLKAGRRGGPPEGIYLALLLVEPTRFGITEWRSGDFAKYRHLRSVEQNGSEDQREVVAIVRGDALGDKALGNKKWLEIRGLALFREVVGSALCIGSCESLWPSADSPVYHIFDKYFPLRDTGLELLSPATAWVQQRKETTRLRGEMAEVTVWHCVVEGWTLPIEVAVSPLARPLGIVWLRLGAQSLDLIESGNVPPSDGLQAHVADLIEGRLPRQIRCATCHSGYKATGIK